LEEKTYQLTAEPAHKIAVPLFLVTSLFYFIPLGYYYFSCCETDNTFAWFGGFYLGLSLLYLANKYWRRL